MRVDIKVNWGELSKELTKESESKSFCPKPIWTGIDRRLWYIALGREIEAVVISGAFTSMAEVSRACGVSRARVTQLLNRI